MPGGAHGGGSASMLCSARAAQTAVTALLPVLGYEQCTRIALEAQQSGRGVYELVLEKELMTREALDRMLNPEAMVAPRHA